MLKTRLAVAALALITALPSLAQAASFDRALDVYQGFNFRKDKTTSVGCITKLKVGTVELKADLHIKNPKNPRQDGRCVAILSSQSWGLGANDAIYTNGQVSETNRQEIQTMLYNDLSGVSVEYQAYLFEYDPRTKKYFTSFHSEGQDLCGMLEKQGPNIALDVATRASTEVEYPENYAFFIGIKPIRSTQHITLQASETKKMAKQWGKGRGKNSCSSKNKRRR
uniref:Uncharacterized protein n=1 Tax=Magnetococcus massalia (strain MO-1) TaxID=451514 RepID=A0A1S7LJM6_MAGMO|nr:Conserved exported protein of unknown function [Candidatus Magnetococcus massalia]